MIDICVDTTIETMVLGPTCHYAARVLCFIFRPSLVLWSHTPIGSQLERPWFIFQNGGECEREKVFYEECRFYLDSILSAWDMICNFRKRDFFWLSRMYQIVSRIVSKIMSHGSLDQCFSTFQSRPPKGSLNFDNIFVVI